MTSEPRVVATLLYPCDMVANDNISLARAQSVALVREAKGIAIPEDWDGAVAVCPLPDLFGDGAMWMVDFTKVANIDRSYLRGDKRLHSLTELGWAVFRQRLALATTRMSIPIEDLIEMGAATWAESELQAMWTGAGRDARSFHGWLDAAEEAHVPWSRREALAHGDAALVRQQLMRELGSSRPRLIADQ